jgi:integrase
MAIERLTDRKLKSIKDPGRYADGGGLYLRVRDGQKGLSKSWVLLIMRAGKRREITLGAYGDGPDQVSLAEARRRAAVERAAVEAGEESKRKRVASVEAGVPTFGQLVDQVLPGITQSLTNEKAKAQWRSTLETYAAPIWGRRVDDITIADVSKALEPIWHEKPETASRTQGRIKRIFDAAIARQYRPDNPADPAPLKHLLGQQIGTVKHHDALPFKELPAFWAGPLARLLSQSADMVRFAILTVARSGEARGALWSEIELDAATWTIPAARMKARKEHVVPLSRSAIHILRKNNANQATGGLVFLSEGHGAGRTKRASKMFSENAGRELLQGIRPGITLHGFRSTFRDWAGDHTDFDREVVEMCLAHAVGNAVERAYRRRTALEKRRDVMEAWERYVTGEVRSAEGVAVTPRQAGAAAAIKIKPRP